MVNPSVNVGQSSDVKNTSKPTARKTLYSLGMEVGADAWFVVDGMIAYLDKNMEYEEAGEYMLIQMHAKLPDGEESKVRRKLAPYLLERCGQAVVQHGSGWFKFEKTEKGAKSFYKLIPVDEKGNPKELPKQKSK